MADARKRVRITITIDALVDPVTVQAAALGGVSTDIDDVGGMTEEERVAITQVDLDGLLLRAVGDYADAVTILTHLSAPWTTVAAAVPSMEIPTGAVGLTTRALRDDERARFEP